MKKSGLWLLMGLLAAGLCLSLPGPQVEKAILEVLDLQKAAWNKGDVEEFMAYYLKSAEITFQSANSRISGWDEVLARYRKNYAREKMGILDFTDLAVHVLSEDSAYVLGRFKLDVAGEHREGLFTLVLRKTEEGWRIVHDHTSS